MKELVQIDPKKYGLESTRANEIAQAFAEPLQEMIALETDFEQFRNLTGEPPKATCQEAKELKKKYVSIRTATAKIHKDEKAVYLNAGRFVDAWKNRQLEISKDREVKLSEISEYHENLLIEQLRKLEVERHAEISQYLDDELIPPGLSAMRDDVWSGYLSNTKAQYLSNIEAEKKAEADRIAAEKAEKEEQDRIRKENEKLKKEAEKKEKALEKERAENEKKLAEERAKRDRLEATKQAELEKERAEKIKLENIERERIEAEKAKAEALKKGSDKEMLNAYLQQMLSIDLPKVKSSEAVEILDGISAFITKLENALNQL